MFGVLVESAPTRRRSVLAGATSSIMHAAGVALVVGATVRAPQALPGARATGHAAEGLTFVTPRRTIVPPAAPRDGSKAKMRSSRRADPRPSRTPEEMMADALSSALPVPELDLGIPVGREDLDAMLDARVSAGVEFADGLDPVGIGRLPMPVYGDVYSEADADRRPMVLAGSRKPVYPLALLQRGVGGTVVARFVIDSTGRPVANSLQIVSSSDELFARSVRDAVRRNRYLPALLAGRTVSVMVEQPFLFVAR